MCVCEGGVRVVTVCVCEGGVRVVTVCGWVVDGG